MKIRELTVTNFRGFKGERPFPLSEQVTLDLLRERREAVIAAAVTGQLDVEVG